MNYVIFFQLLFFPHSMRPIINKQCNGNIYFLNFYCLALSLSLIVSCVYFFLPSICFLFTSKLYKTNARLTIFAIIFTIFVWTFLIFLFSRVECLYSLFAKLFYCSQSFTQICFSVVVITLQQIILATTTILYLVFHCIYMQYMRRLLFNEQFAACLVISFDYSLQ